MSDDAEGTSRQAFALEAGADDAQSTNPKGAAAEAGARKDADTPGTSPDIGC